MDGLLRDGVDLQALSAKTLIGDSYLFEEVTTPGKIKEYLESSKVKFRNRNLANNPSLTLVSF